MDTAPEDGVSELTATQGTGSEPPPARSSAPASTAAPLPSERGLEPIARIGRFELLGRLATGGMAEILLARESTEVGVSRHAVVKVVRGELADQAGFAKMFLNEGRVAMRLSHPNICTVYECGRQHERLFMAMEYVHGRTLREVLMRAAERGAELPVGVVLRVVALTAEALDFAHRATDSEGRPLSIVHRDVTPHNIMVRYDGVVKLLDFGVARVERSEHETADGALKGKYSYMAPEQALGSSLDARADVFSLGVCLFESLTGRRLFHRRSQFETLRAVLESEPPPLSTFRDDIPERLDEIVQRALSKSPDARYPSAGALQHDLELLLAESREVVGTARIRGVMDQLFEQEASRWPALVRDAELRGRYATPTPVAAPVEATRAPDGRGAGTPESVAATSAPGPTHESPPRRASVFVLGAAGLALVLLILGGRAWLGGAPDDVDGESPPSGAAPALAAPSSIDAPEARPPGGSASSDATSAARSDPTPRGDAPPTAATGTPSDAASSHPARPSAETTTAPAAGETRSAAPGNGAAPIAPTPNAPRGGNLSGAEAASPRRPREAPSRRPTRSASTSTGARGRSVIVSDPGF